MGRWNTFVSVLPMKYSVVLDDPEPLDEPEPLDVPDPEVSVLPPGNVRVAPFVENTILPLRSVRYTEMPADESLLSASVVGCS